MSASQFRQKDGISAHTVPVKNQEGIYRHASLVAVLEAAYQMQFSIALDEIVSVVLCAKVLQYGV